ncbi:MAG: type IV pilus secretin PilQ family protein [Betaproteobacteria bacterium]|nr:type IV pilus secretin PilQ family protein [Betaproteobacteria bacterium]MBK6601431.1 type IV pilus secretin PilQ family protein [Betaproteobacteria bacterium]MBK7592676.1 type IV pilus secretin PilQ family protein [Betaproteobacteria bacterium]MBK7742915.1 type IV pilus secretin PilQ family protein [Betaproteobacteria bacterium]MBK8688096.1 type IV pilus secretin PilQ family protein [Betaproteobacteria bacterium]
MSAFVWLDNFAARGRIARGAWATFAALLALVASGVAFAQVANSIDALAVSKGTSGNTIVKFTLKAPPANPPAGFAIASPARIALDFLDTGNGLGATQRVIDDASLRSLNVIQAGNRTRVVLNLNRPQTFSTAVEGNTVLVTLFDQSEQLDAKTQVVQRFAESRPGDVQHTLRDIDFRRGKNGEGRIIVDLSDNATGIDIRQQGKSLIVDFLRTNLPRNLERRLDVQDFGTPVTTVDTVNQGGNARMIIEPKGLWEHSAYQTDNRFIIEVKPIQEDPNRLIQGSRQGYKGERLSLNFQNVEVRAVLQVIADFTGLNIITSDTVQGSLTLRLKDIPWDQALDIIMQTKGLDMRKNGSVVLIAPREELALKEKQQLESQIQISDLEPILSESFQLNYMKAQDLLNLITSNRQQQFGAGAGQTATTGGQGSIISRRGVAMVDPRSNILFVQDTASRLEEIRKIIRQIDTAVRQVLIEARIVVAGDKFSKQLGVRLGVQTGFTLNRKYAGGFGGNLNTQPVVKLEGDRLVRETRTQTPFELASGLASAGYSDSPQLNVNLPVSNPAGQLALTLINLGSGNLVNLELSALESDGRGKVVSSPRVVTQDNQKARIEQGTEIPYVTPGSANSPATVQFKKAVLLLDVVPQITPDNRIIMTVEIRKDSVGQYVQLGGGFQVPSIDTKNVTTQIAVNNGDTAVIGGIYEEVINNDVTKVPFLGDLPVVGWAFKLQGRTSEKTELLIFLTPRVVKDTVSAVK